MAERKLRAVKADEKAPVKRAARKAAPKSVAAAAASGDRRQLLVALGNRIAKAIDDPGTQPTALAALIRQQRDIATDIQAIDDASVEPGGRRAAVIADTPNEAWDESMI